MAYVAIITFMCIAPGYHYIVVIADIKLQSFCRIKHIDYTHQSWSGKFTIQLAIPHRHCHILYLILLYM